MPLYDYFCPSCDSEWEGFNLIDDRRREECKLCGSMADIRPAKIASISMVYPYYSEQMGAEITSSRHREKLAREKGLAPIG